MASTSALVSLVLAPSRGAATSTPSPAQSITVDQVAAGRGQHPPSGRLSPFLSQAAGVALASLTMVSVVVRQLISNAEVPAPLTIAEAALGVNAYARLNLTDLSVPAPGRTTS